MGAGIRRWLAGSRHAQLLPLRSTKLLICIAPASLSEHSISVFDSKAHLCDIDAAISELHQFQPRTTAPAPIAHQFIGTVVDNTLALLTVPANSLDGGHRSIQFSESNNWRSLIRAVHSSFLSQIHLATERALVSICEELNLRVQSSFRLSMLKAIDQIERHTEDLKPIQRALKDVQALARNSRPQFDDYLNAVLSNSKLEKRTKRDWRLFFRALSIVRNKVSHSVAELAESEKVRLIEGGFSVLISQSGKLVINPRIYAQIANHILNFFDLVSPRHDKSELNDRTGRATDRSPRTKEGGLPVSLIISVYVPTGIVVSGDSRTTGTLSQQVPQPTESDPDAVAAIHTQIIISDAANKVFLIHGRFGIGTFGDAIINNMPVAHYIEQFQAQFPGAPQTTELANDLLRYFRSLNPVPSVGFIVAGYDGIIPCVFGVNLQVNLTQRVNIKAGTDELDYGIVRGGDTAIVDRLLSQVQFNPPFTVMNLQDAVDYSRHLIRSTIDQMRFEPRFATVGGDIDTLVILPEESRFLRRKELHCP